MIQPHHVERKRTRDESCEHVQLGGPSKVGQVRHSKTFPSHPAAAREAAAWEATGDWAVKVVPGLSPGEFDGYAPNAVEGILFIRDLSDEDLIAGARDTGSAVCRRIAAHMGGFIEQTWPAARCAEEAYVRGVVDKPEADRITADESW